MTKKKRCARRIFLSSIMFMLSLTNFLPTLNENVIHRINWKILMFNTILLIILDRIAIENVYKLQKNVVKSASEVLDNM